MCIKIFVNTKAAVRIKESTNFGDIVAGLEVVKADFPIEDVTAITEGVDGGKGQAVSSIVAIDGSGHAPCIIVIAELDFSGIIHDASNVTLTVDHIVEGHSVIRNGSRNTVDVGEVHHHTITGHLHQLRSIIDVLVGISAVGLVL